MQMKDNMIRVLSVVGFVATSTAAYVALSRTRQLESQISALLESQIKTTNEHHDLPTKGIDEKFLKPLLEPDNLQEAAREPLDNASLNSGCVCNEDRTVELVLKRIEYEEFAIRASEIARSNAPFLVSGSLQDLQVVVADLLSRIHELKREYGESLSPLKWEEQRFRYDAERIAAAVLPKLEQLCGENAFSVYSRVVGYQSIVKSAEESRGAADSR